MHGSILSIVSLAWNIINTILIIYFQYFHYSKRVKFHFEPSLSKVLELPGGRLMGRVEVTNTGRAEIVVYDAWIVGLHPQTALRLCQGYTKFIEPVGGKSLPCYLKPGETLSLKYCMDLPVPERGRTSLS